LVARILVVDDEELIRDMLSSLLARSGHEVFSAGNADEALAFLEESVPEVAFVDLVMPGKGGLTLIMENLSNWPELNVVAMSGRIPVGTDSMRGLGTTLGISCFLPKPFTSEELDHAVALALSNRCS
jgi:DNA-binding NtrC family response regulator